ncbi:MAG: geranylgeranylglycerol-phosphate geranylgeranyltransferase [Bacteroidota bacterium]
MQKIFAFFKLIRVVNVIIMMIAMMLCYYCLNDYLIAEDLLDRKFILLLISVALTAAAGYIINDYYDVKLDIINKPEKVIIGNIFSRRQAILFHSVLNVLAITASMFINIQVVFAVITSSILLYLYSVSFKKQFLIGNIVISFLSGFMVFIIWLFNKSIPVHLILFYSSFAFISTLIREIIKDTEDIDGDRNYNCKTLPIVAGIAKTKNVIQSMNFIFVGGIILLLLYTNQISFQSKNSENIFSFYILILVLVPSLSVFYMVNKATTKKHFSRLSLVLKLIMIAGIFSMLLIKF